MPDNLDKIIIDTNLWISFLISKNFHKLDSLIINNKARLIFSHELIEEFLTVTDRPKFKRIFLKNDIQRLLELFDFYGELVDVKSKVSLCRDPKDNFLLALAKDSKADFLLTGDTDLLYVKKIGKTKILSLKSYIDSKF
jgi:uncharacterized protein